MTIGEKQVDGVEYAETLLDCFEVDARKEAGGVKNYFKSMLDDRREDGWKKTYPDDHDEITDKDVFYSEYFLLLSSPVLHFFLEKKIN